MPKSLRPMRRRNARTAYECGAERSDFGRRSGDARPRLQLGRSAAAAERSPERRAPVSERHRRPSGAASSMPGIHALADACASLIRSLGVADAHSPPRRKFVRKAGAHLAVSCSNLARPMPFSLEIARLGCADSRLASPRRPEPPATAATAVGLKGVEDQNESGDCRAGARPLMSPGGTVARGGAQPRAAGGQTPLVGRRAMARFLH
jgi:hypothetical protein